MGQAADDAAAGNPKNLPQRLFYIQGIIRNKLLVERQFYYPDKGALPLLSQCWRAGVSVEKLESIAMSLDWNSWYEVRDLLIDSMNSTSDVHDWQKSSIEDVLAAFEGFKTLFSDELKERCSRDFFAATYIKTIVEFLCGFLFYAQDNHQSPVHEQIDGQVPLNMRASCGLEIVYHSLGTAIERCCDDFPEKCIEFLKLVDECHSAAWAKYKENHPLKPGRGDESF